MAFSKDSNHCTSQYHCRNEYDECAIPYSITQSASRRWAACTECNIPFPCWAITSCPAGSYQAALSLAGSEPGLPRASGSRCLLRGADETGRCNGCSGGSPVWRLWLAWMFQEEYGSKRDNTRRSGCQGQNNFRYVNDISRQMVYLLTWNSVYSFLSGPR